MNESKPNKYFAFISYKREDEEWAIWFHHELENYHLPISLNGRADLPTEFRPVFRDIDELKAGNLPEQIYNALASSAHLVVICSPNSAKSEWVNKEIRDFIEIGKVKGIDNVRKIFPFIVDGRPHSRSKAEECFPKALLELSKNEEIVGGNVNEGNRDWCGNVNESGRDKAFVKVLAGMLSNVAFDELWNRYEKDRAEKERIERERTNNLLRMQSRVVAEKAMVIAEEDSCLARLIALEVLPKDLENPDRPYTVEAEKALRKAIMFNITVIKGKGYDSEVYSVAFSPDGKRVVSTSYNTIYVWDAELGTELVVICGYCGVKSAVFSPDGKRIVAALEDRIYVWDAETGVELLVLKGHCGHINSVEFSSDGKYIVSASESVIYGLPVFDDSHIIVPEKEFEDNTIRIWDAETGKELNVLEGHDHFVYSAVFSPDGTRVVSTSRDKTIRVWDTETGKEKYALRRNGKEVISAVFSPDGKHILSIFDDAVCVWDVDTGKELIDTGKELNVLGHGVWGTYAVFSPDGKRIVDTSGDGIYVWDTETGVELQLLKCYGKSCSPVISPDGKRIVFAYYNDTIRIQDLGIGRPLNLSHGHIVHSSAFGSDGRYCIVSYGNSISIWSLETGQELNVLVGHGAEVESVNVSPDGTRVVSTSRDKTIRVWEIETGKELNVLEGHDDIVRSAEFSPDGKRIISADDRTIRVWSAETGRELRILYSSPRRRSLFYTYSPDGSRIATIGVDGEMYIWDARTGEELAKSEILLDLNADYESVGFSPDGKYIVAVSRYKKIVIWNVEKWMKLKKNHESYDIWNADYHPVEEKFDGYNAVYSPDGKRIILGTDDIILIWDVELGVVLNNIQNAELRTYNGASIFSSDGKCFFYLGNNGIHIWNLTVGDDVMIIPIPRDRNNVARRVILNIIFTKDSQQIIVVFADGTVRIWDFPPLQELIDQTRERFKDRPLTPEERKQYYLE